MEALIIALAYLAPSILAGFRKHNDVIAISVLNLLLGWTGLGWVAALIWASTGNVRRD